MRLLAVPGARAPQTRHNLDEIFPGMTVRAGRQRDERHRDRRRKGRFRHAGDDLRRNAARFKRAQEHGQSGKVAERIAQHAEAEVATRVNRDAIDKRIDLFAAAADEERRPVDEIADKLDAFAFDEQRKFRRCKHRRCTTDGAQRFKAPQRQQVRVAWAEPDDADHAGSFNRLRSVYFVEAAGDGAAAEDAGAGGTGALASSL